MNRNFPYASAMNQRQTGVVCPIEERLRIRYANRGLGAPNVRAARAAVSRQSAMRPRSVGGAQPGQRVPAGRPLQRPAVPQRLSAPQRPSAPRGGQMQVRPKRPIVESRPPVSQKIPLYEKKVRRAPLPVAALVCLLICALTVFSVVWGAAMVGRASQEVNDLQNQVAALANTERELSQALDRKNDLRTIERIAVDELGMIGTDLITKKYISFSGIDVIEAYDDEEGKSVGLSTLLSAIGIGIN